MRSLTCLCLGLSVLVLMPVPQARADLLGWIAGDTVEATIDRTEAALDKFSARMEGFGAEYAARLENLVASTIRATGQEADRLRAAIRADVFALEKQVFDHITNTLWGAECAAVRLAEGTFQNAVASMVSRVVERNPRASLELFGFEIARLTAAADPNDVAVPRPDELYYRLRKTSLNLLEKQVEEAGERASAYPIYSTLLDLSQLARQTACRFPGTTAEQRFIKEHFDFAALASRWDKVVSVQYVP